MVYCLLLDDVTQMMRKYQGLFFSLLEQLTTLIVDAYSAKGKASMTSLHKRLGETHDVSSSLEADGPGKIYVSQ